MILLRYLLFLLLLLQAKDKCDALSFANILNSSYSTGVPFMQINIFKPAVCMCTCINHPHCLSISVSRSVSGTSDSYFCQLFATYPSQTNQITSLSNSNISIFTERALNSTKILFNNKLISPSNIFADNSSNVPWVPLFLLRSGNNQSFLWINSSVSTSLSPVPNLLTDTSGPHWSNVLVSQWNQGSYRPQQVALALFVNQSTMIDFLIFNSSQADIYTWFSISRLLSTQYWLIPLYQNTMIGQTQMKSIYQDSDCTRSFNCNFKYSSNSCSTDFYGFFFVYGGIRDQCISSVRSLSQVPIPTIFYTRTKDHTTGNFTEYSQAFGLFVFVR